MKMKSQKMICLTEYVKTVHKGEKNGRIWTSNINSTYVLKFKELGKRTK